MIGISLFTLLSADTELTGMVGTNIFPVEANQRKEDPIIIYWVKSVEPTDTKENVSNEDWVKGEIMVYSKNYDLMQTISKRVRTILDKYAGTVAGNEISEIRFEDFMDGWEPERKGYVGTSDYLIVTT
jgi:hypothetical protein